MTEYDTRSVPEAENKEFCHIPTSRGFPISIVQGSLQLSFFDPPKKALAPLRLFWKFSQKIKFRKKGPRM